MLLRLELRRLSRTRASSSRGAVNRAALKGARRTQGACRNTGRATSRDALSGSNQALVLRLADGMQTAANDPARGLDGAGVVRLGGTPITRL